MIIYFIIFFIICGFLIIPSERKVDSALICLFFSTILLFFAGLRPRDSSTDYEIYLQMYDDLNISLSLKDLFGFTEPTFVLIGTFTKFLKLPVTIVFLVYATIGVSIKSLSILKYSDFIIPSFLVYYCNYFLLHEMTQIRIGVASSIFIIAVQFIVQRNMWKYFLMIGLAILFHYSAIIYLPLYFINSASINKVKYYIFIIVSIIIGFLKIPFLDYLKYIPINVVQQKQELYSGVLELGIVDTNINLLNPFALIDIFICLFLLYNSKYLATKNRYFITFLKIYIIGLCTFYLFSSFPSIAFRVKEMFVVSQFISIPFILYLFPKSKLIPITFILLICLVYLYYNTYNTHLVKSYDFFKFIYNSSNI